MRWGGWTARERGEREGESKHLHWCDPDPENRPFLSVRCISTANAGSGTNSSRFFCSSYSFFCDSMNLKGGVGARAGASVSWLERVPRASVCRVRYPGR